MKQFPLLNRITGWITFLIATTVYLLTVEPTTSFWDCGEFISAAYKLEVGHPPGAPFFMLLGNFFSKFASSPEQVALMINRMSALASGFTIMFLFWTITHLARRIVKEEDEELKTGKILGILGAGLVGALAYTFSDTFWFSAVEGEVYATSSLFTAIVFWAILKWENIADKPHANRWLVLIAYLMGISIGVHLLNLLAIPAIVMVYYYRKYEGSRRGVITALLVSVLILGLIQFVIIPGIVTIGTWFELFFVNGIGFPFDSGLLIYIVLLFGFLAWWIWYTHQRGRVLWNTVALCLTMIVVGYSSYAVIYIRSSANPPMDQSNPENVFSLLSYLNREQYGSNPLVYGEYYNAPILDTKSGKKRYVKEEGKYKHTSRRPEYVYDERFKTIFPRMWSPESRHEAEYEYWGKIKGTPVRVERNRGETSTIRKPTFGENLRFFFRYQVGHMYMRYFMWNFAGRQNDLQGHGELWKGNWLSGIGFIDNPRLGDPGDWPEFMKENKALNRYYMLPFLLGLLGLFFHYRKKRGDFWVVLLLFLFTGLAIVIYLNQYPLQPRERDYAYAGSFYTFAIWIGLGVLALTALLKKLMPYSLSAIMATLVTLIFVPVIMARENWDDHDRSGRYTARDFAKNYLNSCQPQSILFTNGDNDTFPLWYVQEVEGIRTDIKVVNMSYLTADWYIEQMASRSYEAEPVPFGVEPEIYRQGTRDIAYLIDRFNRPIKLDEAMEFLSSENPATKRLPNIRERVEYIPAKSFFIPVDSSDILERGVVRKVYADQIVDRIEWTINKEYIVKNEIMVLYLLANNGWERPVYYAVTVSSDNYLNLQNYFQIHGLAYRIVPINTPVTQGQIGHIDTGIMYDNMINKYQWGNVQDTDVYLDENNLRMLSNFRNNFARLANALIDEGKIDSARVVLDRCMEIMPHERVPYNFFILDIIEGYHQIGEHDRGGEMTGAFYKLNNEELDYFTSLMNSGQRDADYEVRLRMHILQEMLRLTETYGPQELYQEMEQDFQQKMMIFSSGRMQ